MSQLTFKREMPDFFYKCVERTKTKAVIRGKLKDGTEFTAVIKSVYFNDYGCQSLFSTYELINLLRGNIKKFQDHPAVRMYRHRTEITD